MTETVRTLDILAENGIEYVGNWVNDEQPYPMKVKKGSMISMPYSSEINDIPALLSLHQSPERFGQMICDQFDVLYEDGAKTGRVMSICLHPFLIGHPHRSKYFAKALAHITSRQEVWLATGSEIVDWYKKNYLKNARRAHGLDRLADLVDLHRAHALVVGRGVQAADLEARQIVHQEGVGAHAVERADVAREQRAPLLVGQIERRQRLGRIGLHRRAEGVIAQHFAAQMIDGEDRHGCLRFLVRYGLDRA